MISKMKRYSVLLLAMIWSASLMGQSRASRIWLPQIASSARPAGNAINDILLSGMDVWIGTRSLSRTSDDGLTWTIYTTDDGMGKGSVSALASHNGAIWAATAFDTLFGEETEPAGGGLGYTIDNGMTWTWIPQPVDPADVTDYRPTTNRIQNVIYDVALTDDAVWIASFLGGLRRSADMGETWDVVTVDGFPFNAMGPLTHQLFSVHYDGDALWAGSAGGVHKSTDGGRSWTTFNHQNQSAPISGNFVVAIDHQTFGGRKRIWAATIEAVDTSETRAVSVTDDGGLTWRVSLTGHFSYNFAFDAGTGAAYAATDKGLYKSPDFGETWAVFPQIVDHATGEAVFATAIYSVAVADDGTLWAGTGDGLARSRDNGATWRVFRAFQPPGEDGAPQTYAYPNPFSPLRHNLADGDGHVRFQYRTTRSAQVTVRVYDFAMHLVRTVVDSRDRPVPGDYAEVWDGRSDVGEAVANGVYFYQILLDDAEPLWGKVMVVN